MSAHIVDQDFIVGLRMHGFLPDKADNLLAQALVSHVFQRIG